MKTLEQILTERMAVPVRNKAGATLTNEQGEALLPMEAMVMSVMQNAMRGDIQAITFIRNFTQKAADDNPEYRKEQDRLLSHNTADIKAQLQDEGLYDPTLDFEIERLANTLLVVQRIEKVMRQPDHRDITSDVSRTGQTTVRLNIVNDIRQKQLQQFNTDLQRLRTTAMNHRQMKRQNERKKTK